MKPYRQKNIYLLFTSIFIFLLHIPFLFAKNSPVLTTPNIYSVTPALVKPNLTQPNATKDFGNIYDSLQLSDLGLSPKAFQCAVQGLDYLLKAKKITDDKIISIVDFSLPSNKKRLFVIDLKKCKIIFNTYVAHGVNSGKEYANQFSNAPQSNKSSLGFYKTMNTYVGKNGYSLHLQGLEKGINDNADSRAIVMHGAPYVNENLIQSQGYIGRSWGCPAVPVNLHKPIIDEIKNGSCLFIYSSNNNYLAHSKILAPQSGI